MKSNIRLALNKVVAIVVLSAFLINNFSFAAESFRSVNVSDETLSPELLLSNSEKQAAFQSRLICETIEKRANYGKDDLSIDDLKIWSELDPSEQEFDNVVFLNHKDEVHLLVSGTLLIRYYKTDGDRLDFLFESESGFKNLLSNIEVAPGLERQIYKLTGSNKSLEDIFRHIRDKAKLKGLVEFDPESSFEAGNDEYKVAELTPKGKLRIHPWFRRHFEHIRESSIGFSYTFNDGIARWIDLAESIAYRVAMHEFDLDGRSGKGHGYNDDGKFALRNGGSSEHDANFVGERYSVVDDAMWLWYLHSYAMDDDSGYPGDVRYDNEAFERRLRLWLFADAAMIDKMRNSKKKQRLITARAEFPALFENTDKREQAISLALLINNQFFSARSELGVDTEPDMTDTTVINASGLFQPSNVGAVRATGSVPEPGSGNTFRHRPSRKQDERLAEIRAGMELWRRIDRACGRLKTAKEQWRNATDDQAKERIRGDVNVLVRYLADIYNDITIPDLKAEGSRNWVEGQPYKYYSDLLKEVRKEQDEIYLTKERIGKYLRAKRNITTCKAKLQDVTNTNERERLLSELSASQKVLKRLSDYKKIAKNRRSLKKINSTAIRLDKFMTKLGIKIAGMQLYGRTQLYSASAIFNAADKTLVKASKNGFLLKEELRNRFSLLEKPDKMQEFDTVDWEGHLVRTSSIKGFDMEILTGEGESGDEMVVLMEQNYWINTRNHLQEIRRAVRRMVRSKSDKINIRRTDWREAMDKIDTLISLYSVRYKVALQKYKDFAIELKDLKGVISSLSINVPPPVEAYTPIAERLDSIRDRIHPNDAKQKKWTQVRVVKSSDEVTDPLEPLKKAFRSRVHAIKRYEPEYAYYVGRIMDLEYFIKALTQAKEEKKLSKDDRRVIISTLNVIRDWAGRGSVDAKTCFMDNEKYIHAAIDSRDFDEALRRLTTVLYAFKDRLTDIAGDGIDPRRIGIVGNYKKRAAALFDELRDRETKLLVTGAFKTLTGTTAEDLHSQLGYLVETYFTKDMDQEVHIRVEEIITQARSDIDSLRTNYSGSKALEVKENLRLIAILSDTSITRNVLSKLEYGTRNRKKRVATIHEAVRDITFVLNTYFYLRHNEPGYQRAKDTMTSALEDVKVLSTQFSGRKLNQILTKLRRVVTDISHKKYFKLTIYFSDGEKRDMFVPEGTKIPGVINLLKSYGHWQPEANNTLISRGQAWRRGNDDELKDKIIRNNMKLWIHDASTAQMGRRVNAGASYEIPEKPGEKYFDITDHKGQPLKQFIELTPVENIDISILLHDIDTKYPGYDEIILNFLQLLENSPPAIFSFDKTVGDLYGFADDRQKLIAAHNDLLGNPVSVFHELGEYLIKNGLLTIESQDGTLNMLFMGQDIVSVELSSDTMAIFETEEWFDAEKGAIRNKFLPMSGHYSLRLLAGEMFGAKNLELTRDINFDKIKNLTAFPQNTDLVKNILEVCKNMPARDLSELMRRDRMGFMLPPKKIKEISGNPSSYFNHLCQSLIENNILMLDIEKNASNETVDILVLLDVGTGEAAYETRLSGLPLVYFEADKWWDAAERKIVNNGNEHYTRKPDVYYLRPLIRMLFREGDQIADLSAMIEKTLKIGSKNTPKTREVYIYNGASLTAEDNSIDEFKTSYSIDESGVTSRRVLSTVPSKTINEMEQGVLVISTTPFGSANAGASTLAGSLSAWGDQRVIVEIVDGAPYRVFVKKDDPGSGITLRHHRHSKDVYLNAEIEETDAENNEFVYMPDRDFPAKTSVLTDDKLSDFLSQVEDGKSLIISSTVPESGTVNIGNFTVFKDTADSNAADSMKGEEIFIEIIAIDGLTLTFSTYRKGEDLTLHQLGNNVSVRAQRTHTPRKNGDELSWQASRKKDDKNTRKTEKKPGNGNGKLTRDINFAKGNVFEEYVWKLFNLAYGINGFTSQDERIVSSFTTEVRRPDFVVHDNGASYIADTKWGLSQQDIEKTIIKYLRLNNMHDIGDKIVIVVFDDTHKDAVKENMGELGIISGTDYELINITDFFNDIITPGIIARFTNELDSERDEIFRELYEKYKPNITRTAKVDIIQAPTMPDTTGMNKSASRKAIRDFERKKRKFEIELAKKRKAQKAVDERAIRNADEAENLAKNRANKEADAAINAKISEKLVEFRTNVFNELISDISQLSERIRRSTTSRSKRELLAFMENEMLKPAAQERIRICRGTSNTGNRQGAGSILIKDDELWRETHLEPNFIYNIDDSGRFARLVEELELIHDNFEPYWFDPARQQYVKDRMRAFVSYVCDQMDIDPLHDPEENLDEGFLEVHESIKKLIEKTGLFNEGENVRTIWHDVIGRYQSGELKEEEDDVDVSEESTDNVSASPTGAISETSAGSTSKTSTSRIQGNDSTSVQPKYDSFGRYELRHKVSHIGGEGAFGAVVQSDKPKKGTRRPFHDRAVSEISDLVNASGWGCLLGKDVRFTRRHKPSIPVYTRAAVLFADDLPMIELMFSDISDPANNVSYNKDIWSALAPLQAHTIMETRNLKRYIKMVPDPGMREMLKDKAEQLAASGNNTKVRIIKLINNNHDKFMKQDALFELGGMIMYLMKIEALNGDEVMQRFLDRWLMMWRKKMVSGEGFDASYFNKLGVAAGENKKNSSSAFYEGLFGDMFSMSVDDDSILYSLGMNLTDEEKEYFADLKALFATRFSVNGKIFYSRMRDESWRNPEYFENSDMDNPIYPATGDAGNEFADYPELCKLTRQNSHDQSIVPDRHVLELLQDKNDRKIFGFYYSDIFGDIFYGDEVWNDILGFTSKFLASKNGKIASDLVEQYGLIYLQEFVELTKVWSDSADISNEWEVSYRKDKLELLSDFANSTFVSTLLKGSVPSESRSTENASNSNQPTRHYNFIPVAQMFYTSTAVNYGGQTQPINKTSADKVRVVDNNVLNSITSMLNRSGLGCLLDRDVRFSYRSQDDHFAEVESEVIEGRAGCVTLLNFYDQPRDKQHSIMLEAGLSSWNPEQTLEFLTNDSDGLEKYKDVVPHEAARQFLRNRAISLGRNIPKLPNGITFFRQNKEAFRKIDILNEMGGRIFDVMQFHAANGDKTCKAFLDRWHIMFMRKLSEPDGINSVFYKRLTRGTLETKRDRMSVFYESIFGDMFTMYVNNGLFPKPLNMRLTKEEKRYFDDLAMFFRSSHSEQGKIFVTDIGETQEPVGSILQTDSRVGFFPFAGFIVDYINIADEEELRSYLVTGDQYSRNNEGIDTLFEERTVSIFLNRQDLIARTGINEASLNVIEHMIDVKYRNLIADTTINNKADVHDTAITSSDTDELTLFGMKFKDIFETGYFGHEKRMKLIEIADRIFMGTYGNISRRKDIANIYKFIDLAAKQIVKSDIPLQEQLSNATMDLSVLEHIKCILAVPEARKLLDEQNVAVVMPESPVHPFEIDESYIEPLRHILGYLKTTMSQEDYYESKLAIMSMCSIPAIDDREYFNAIISCGDKDPDAYSILFDTSSMYNSYHDEIDDWKKKYEESNNKDEAFMAISATETYKSALDSGKLMVLSSAGESIKFVIAKSNDIHNTPIEKKAALMHIIFALKGFYLRAAKLIGPIPSFQQSADNVSVENMAHSRFSLRTKEDIETLFHEKASINHPDLKKYGTDNSLRRIITETSTLFPIFKVFENELFAHLAGEKTVIDDIEVNSPAYTPIVLEPKTTDQHTSLKPSEWLKEF